MTVCNYLLHFLGKRDLIWYSVTPLPVYVFVQVRPENDN